MRGWHIGALAAVLVVVGAAAYGPARLGDDVGALVGAGSGDSLAADPGDDIVPVVVTPGDLPRGDTPRTLYMRKGGIHAPGRGLAVHVDLPGKAGARELSLIGRTPGGYLVRRGGEVWKVSRGENEEHVLDDTRSAFFRSNFDGTRLIALHRGRGEDLTYLTVLDLADDRVVFDDYSETFPQVLGFADEVPLMVSGTQIYRWDPATGEETTVVATDGWAAFASDRFDLVGYRQDDEFRFARLSDPEDVAWTSPDAYPVSVSRDGARLVTTTVDERDQASEQLLEVHDTATGDTLARFTTEGSFDFTSVNWESDDAFLVTVAEPDGVANVRCTVEGSCERTTPYLRDWSRLRLSFANAASYWSYY